MACPRCGSTKVFRSQSSDRTLYRMALLARVRCHSCFSKFFVAYWKADEATASQAAQQGFAPGA
jgi:transposase-like protein